MNHEKTDWEDEALISQAFPMWVTLGFISGGLTGLLVPPHVMKPLHRVHFVCFREELSLHPVGVPQGTVLCSINSQGKKILGLVPIKPPKSRLITKSVVDGKTFSL